MKLWDTRIEVGGVLRCCHETVAKEYDHGEARVEVGAESSCRYCEERFRLTEDGVWKPLWQLEELG